MPHSAICKMQRCFAKCEGALRIANGCRLLFAKAPVFLGLILRKAGMNIASLSNIMMEKWQ